MIRHMEKQKGIQTTLFDYFNDAEYFTIQEANEFGFRTSKTGCKRPQYSSKNI